jgi:hypothetical protein
LISIVHSQTFFGRIANIIPSNAICHLNFHARATDRLAQITARGLSSAIMMKEGRSAFAKSHFGVVLLSWTYRAEAPPYKCPATIQHQPNLNLSCVSQCVPSRI